MASTPSLAISSRYEDALTFACSLHRTQFRKGTAIPYISHLLSVSALVFEFGGGEDEAIAGLLHDAIEDAGGTATGERIRARFGDAVADIVVACTDASEDPKPPWRARKEAYVGHIAHAPSAARLVSACDKLHNARCIVQDLRTQGAFLFDRFSGGREGVLWYYRALVEAFRGPTPASTLGAVPPSPLVLELDRTVAEMERLGDSASAT